MVGVDQDAVDHLLIVGAPLPGLLHCCLLLGLPAVRRTRPTRRTYCRALIPGHEHSCAWPAIRTELCGNTCRWRVILV